MKYNGYDIIVFLLIIMFDGCADTDHNQSQSLTYNIINKIELETVPPYNITDNLSDTVSIKTRSVAVGSNLTISYGFENGDTVGIFPEKDYQIPFALPVPKGTVQTSSSILAQGWMTKKSVLYSVYLPWKFENRNYNHIPWDYRIIQVQDGNDNTKRLGTYWFLASDTLTSGDASFGAKLINMGAIIRVQVVAPVTGTFVRMILASPDKSFATYGYYDLFDVLSPKEDINGAKITSNPYLHQPFHALGYSDHVTLDFKNVTMNAGGKLRGWFVIPETDVRNKLLTVYLWDSNGNCYTAQVTSSTANWTRNTINATGFPSLSLTTTPFTNLNPWESNENICPTCTPVAF